MKNKIILYYDEEGDYLELSIGKIEKGYFKKIKKDCFKRIDEKTGKVVGYTIFNFTKKDGFNEIELPLTKEIAGWKMEKSKISKEMKKHNISEKDMKKHNITPDDIKKFKKSIKGYEKLLEAIGRLWKTKKW